MHGGPRGVPAVLFTCVIVATMAAAALAGGPRASAQSAPGGSTGATGATSCPSSNPPNELTLGGGTPQTAQLDSAFGSGLQVSLANTDGCAITTALAGTPVTFTAPSSGASATFGASGSNTLTVGTDPTGSASAQMLTANDTPGTYTVTASCAYGSVSFSLTNSAAGIPATITPEDPTSEHAKVDSRYPDPLAVRVLDANGNPVVGATVAFTLGAGGDTGGSGAASAGASFDGGGTQATETTNSDGIATSPDFKANATSGRFTATATTAHVVEPAQFALENQRVGPETITLLGPAQRQATVDTRYGRRLQIRVRNADGSPVAGATVTFALGAGGGATDASDGTGSGAGASFTGGSTQATETTAANGIATSPRFSANDVAGTFTATATATGTHGLALFRLHNHAGAPTTIAAGVGATQTAGIGTRFAIPLAVTVTDAHGNRVPDARVTFKAPTIGASGTFGDGRTSVTVTTNGTGVAVAPPFSANGDAGGYIVMATTGRARAAAFALVNTTA